VFSVAPSDPREHEAPPMPSKDAARRSMTRPHNQLLGTNRGISTADYAKSLADGRKAQAPSVPARVKTAADYATTWRLAGRPRGRNQHAAVP
jgi:hypothetical protein